MDDREDLNEQFGELIELIKKEKSRDFSIKPFERKKTRFRPKWLILFACLFIILLSNDKWSYNIYFILLSFIRLILLQVSDCDMQMPNDKQKFSSRFFPFGIGRESIRIHVSSPIHFIIIRLISLTVK